MSKKILLTGGTGFVGSELIKNLVDLNYDIGAVVRERSDLSNISNNLKKIKLIVYENDKNLVREIGHYKPDLIVHIGSFYSVEHTLEDIRKLTESNITFGTFILEAMAQYDIKHLINIGTSWQHYNNESYNPVNLYAATKQAFVDIIKYYIDSYDIKCITLKLFDTYGETDKRGKLINYISSQHNNKILKLSNGYQKIDLVHVDDVCNGIIVSIDRLLKRNNETNYEDFAITSGVPITLRQLINKYSEILDNDVDVEWGAREYRKREVMIPWDNYRTLPNWEPKISLNDGLLRIVKMNRDENHE